MLAPEMIAAMAASCLLHAAILVLPYLGEPVREDRSTVKGSRKSPPPFDAFLVRQGESRFSVRPVPAEGAQALKPAMSDSRSGAASPTDEFRSAGAGLLPIPATVYYGTDQVTKRPQPVTSVDLESPAIRLIVASGRIILKLWISDRGDVARIDVEKSDLPPLFAQTAVEAFKRLRFVPGELYGRPVGTVMRIEVNYQDGRAPPS